MPPAGPRGGPRDVRPHHRVAGGPDGSFALGIVLSLALAVATSCGRASPSARVGAGAGIPPDRAGGAADASVGETLLDWRPTTLPNGVRVVIPDEATLTILGDAAAGRVVSGFRPVRVGVWYGPGNDLAAWRDGIGSNPGATFGAETDATACGLPARRLEAATPGLPPDHVVLQGGADRLEENPAETFVAVAFERAGGPIVAFYVVATARREEHARDEAHFFASIGCPGS